MRIKTVDVVIPVYKPRKEFHILMKRLFRQTVRPSRIIIMNTRFPGTDLSSYEGKKYIEIYDLDSKDFDHGGTRDWAAGISDADAILFMTQDAVPEDEHLIEELLIPFDDENVGAVYARQLPRKDCNIIEQYTRGFNYPDYDISKSIYDLPQMGIKTYFCSDVCAMYRRDVYKEMGGFVSPVIFNEDMIMASRIIKSGRNVYYASRARVIHSHNYTLKQQFQRNFDLAVSQVDHPEVFEEVESESEGKKMVMAAAGYLVDIRKPWLIPKLVISSGAKYLGYYFGKRYRRLSMDTIYKFTSNLNYWR